MMMVRLGLRLQDITYGGSQADWMHFLGAGPGSRNCLALMDLTKVVSLSLSIRQTERNLT